MRLRFLRSRWSLRSRAERYRAVHEAWLEVALRRREAGALRIPARRVAEGGFSHLRSSPEGRVWAESWWREAFSRADSLSG